MSGARRGRSPGRVARAGPLTRLGRLQPAHLPVALRPILFGALGSLLLLAGLVATPAFHASVPLVSEVIAGNAEVPATVRIVAYLAAGISAAAGVASSLAAATVRPEDPAAARLLVAAVPILAGLLPVLWLAAQQQVVLAVPGCLAVAGSIAAAVAAAADTVSAPRQSIWILLAGVFALLPWAGATVPVLAGTEPPSVLWIALVLLASGLTLVLALFGVVRASVKRTDWLSRVLRRERRVAVGWIVLAGIACLYLARFVWLPDLFGEGSLWRLGSPTTWPHALLTAAVVVSVVLRSEAAPVSPRGRLPLFLLLILSLTLGLNVASLAGVVLLIARAVPAAGIDVAALLEAVALPVAIPAVLVAAVLAVLPSGRHSMGRMIAIVAVAHLLPIAVREVSDPTLTEPGRSGWFAPATTVLAALVVLVAVLLAVRTLRPRTGIPVNALLRLLVLPFLGVHALVLLPALAAQEIALAAVALGAIAGIALLLPPVAADRRRHTAVVLGAVAAGVLALTVFTLAASDPGFTEYANGVAVLWLGVPVAAALCLRRLPTARIVPTA